MTPRGPCRRSFSHALAAAALAGAAACSSAGKGPAAATPLAVAGAASETAGAGDRGASAPAESPAPAVAPRGPLTENGARAYMLELINRDRASMGLAPVKLDAAAAAHAGQGHADDMASHGYLGHWGTDGSVPEQRSTLAGGTDMVLENANCFTDGHRRALDPSPRIDPASVEQAESLFFNEKPPNDGHRRNILHPWHTRVGIGVAQPSATPTEIPTPCFAQEFVDAYGAYTPVPRAMRVGDKLHVAGTLRAPAKFAGVGLARVNASGPIPVEELNRRRSYPVPAPYQMYWPPGFQTPIPVDVHGADFSIDLPVSDRGRGGLYELSVWATVPGSTDFVIVSLRTIRVSGK
jgi:uncharacterized protein YkwD